MDSFIDIFMFRIYFLKVLVLFGGLLFSLTLGYFLGKIRGKQELIDDLKKEGLNDG